MKVCEYFTITEKAYQVIVNLRLKLWCVPSPSASVVVSTSRSAKH